MSGVSYCHHPTDKFSIAQLARAFGVPLYPSAFRESHLCHIITLSSAYQIRHRLPLIRLLYLYSVPTLTLKRIKLEPPKTRYLFTPHDCSVLEFVASFPYPYSSFSNILAPKDLHFFSVTSLAVILAVLPKVFYSNC
jgi:hypothetical protein